MPVLDEASVKQLIRPHNVQTVGECRSVKNRFRDENDLFCWRGIVTQQRGKNCTLATTCHPVSFIEARNSFCGAYGQGKIGGCQIGKYVADPTAPFIPNRRGGVVVYNELRECAGIMGFINCSMGGLKESITTLASHAERRNKAM